MRHEEVRSWTKRRTLDKPSALKSHHKRGAETDCDEAMALPYVVLQKRFVCSSFVSLLQKSVTVMSLLVSKVREYQLQHTRLQTSFSSKSGCRWRCCDLSVCPLALSFSLSHFRVVTRACVEARPVASLIYPCYCAHNILLRAPIHIFLSSIQGGAECKARRDWPRRW